MRVTPQANITDGTGTTIPAKTAAQARKVLARTARLQGGTITVTQHGYDPADPTAGPTLAINPNGRVEEHSGAVSGPQWSVGYHSWVIDVEHEGSYNVPGLPTALGDAQMLADRLNVPVIVHVEDIKPDTSTTHHTRIEPIEPTEPDPAEAETAPPHPVPGYEATEEKAEEPDGTDAEAESSVMEAPEQVRAAEPGAHPGPEPAVVLQDTGKDKSVGQPHPGTELAGPAEEDDYEAHPPIPARAKRRRVLLALLVALVLLAGGTTTAVTTVLGALSPAPPPALPGPAPVLWEAEAVPGETALAAHGVLVNAGPGKAEVFSLEDGKALGGGALPEGRARVLSGTDAVFAMVTGPDGTTTGYVATPTGVKDFKGVHGTLVARGSEPFFLTGTGKDQAALVWDGTSFNPVPAPEPGMAPVAASKAGVLWLGVNGRMVRGTTTTALQTPEGATKIISWVSATETSVAVLWDTAKGNVLAVHSIAEGKLTGQVPVPDAEIRKDGDLIRAGAQAFTIDSGTPVAADCADPVPTGGWQWCKAGNTWAADNARPLAPGQTPVPSPADVVITATDKGFTAYPGDAMNNDHDH